jgi:hypothetical protein
MPPKRKSKDVEGKSVSVAKKAKLSSELKPKPAAKAEAKPGAKTPARPKSKTPVKPRAKTPVKPRAKTPVKPRAKTPVKPRAKTPVKPRTKTPVHSVERGSKKLSVTKSDASTPSRSRPKEWEDQAALAMREHLLQMRSAKPVKILKDTLPSPSVEDNSFNSYLEAYMNLPTLKHRDELPSCYFRACIFDGYRDHWNWQETTVSLFSMHNETMCIWSHLLPLLCAIAASVWLSLQMQADGSTFVEQLMMGIFIFTACTCLFLSSLYHWYGCMSEGYYFCLLSFDLGGIACLIAGSFFPGVYYG